MSSGLRDVNEDTSDKLHGVENLGVVSVVPGFCLVENLVCVRLVMDPLQADGRTEHIVGQSLQTGLVTGIDGGGIMNRETAVFPRRDQTYALVADESHVFEEAKDFVAE
jgi:hypothetical protein